MLVLSSNLAVSNRQISEASTFKCLFSASTSTEKFRPGSGAEANR